jgi:hypothetical protein
MKSSIVIIASGLFLSLPLLNANAQSSATPVETVQVVHPAATTPKKTVIGTVTIVVSLTVNADIPAGTPISFSASASAYDTNYTNSHNVGATGTVAGGKVSITLKFPYEFLVSSTADQMSVQLDARTSAGSSPSYSFSTDFSSHVALPANGASTTVRFTGSI